MSQKTLLRIFLGLVFMSFSLVIGQNHAAAAGCTVPSPFGLAPCQGYFTGVTESNFNAAVNIFPSGIVDSNGVYANSGATFISDINSFLYSGNHQDQIGGAFVIDTMMGFNGFNQGNGNFSNGVYQAQLSEASWETLVNSYAYSPPSGYGVTWGGSPVCNAGTLNSGYFTNMADDAFHGTDCVNNLDSTPVITFYWPGGSYEIGLWCGNLEGTVVPLQPIPKPYAPYASLSITCNQPASQYDAIVGFGDYNGYPTSATLSIGVWSYPVGSGSNPIPTGETSSGSPQQFTLTVNDNNGQAYAYAYASTQPPCKALTLSCGGLTISPVTLDPYMSYSATVTVANSSGQSPPGGATMGLTVTNPPSASYYYYNSSQAASWNGAASSAIFGLSPTLSTGVYTATWTLSTPSTNISCPGTFQVVNLPYLQVYGGDTMIGTSPDASTLTCDQNQSAGIYSWNRGSPDYSGAGDQFAVQALGLINSYASAQSSASSPPTGLSLANFPPGTDGSSGTGLDSNDCNFTIDLSGAPVQGSSVTLPSSVGGTDTIYATGNVYIGNNVIYTNTGGWANVSDIPYFKLIVVGGNIYIDRSVTELDGLYVAEPSGGKGGTIYTCATGGLPSPAYSPAGTGAITNYYSICNTKLTIYGSFVAQQVEFLRTYGTAGQADYNGHSDSVTSNYAGEVFDYTPEMWLPRDNSAPSDSYTAITGLPPEL